MRDITDQEWQCFDVYQVFPNVRPQFENLTIPGWSIHEENPSDYENFASLSLDRYGLAITGANHFLHLPGSALLSLSPQGWGMLCDLGAKIEREKPDYDTLIKEYGFKVW